MLQRSPTYVAMGARISPSTELVRKFCRAECLTVTPSGENALQEGAVWFVSRKFPKLMRCCFAAGR